MKPGRAAVPIFQKYCQFGRIYQNNTETPKNNKALYIFHLHFIYNQHK